MDERETAIPIPKRRIITSSEIIREALVVKVAMAAMVAMLHNQICVVTAVLLVREDLAEILQRKKAQTSVYLATPTTTVLLATLPVERVRLTRHMA